MASPEKIIEDALQKGEKSLSEYDSKRVLAAYGIPVTLEKTVKNKNDAVSAAKEIGYPVALKGSGEQLSHKTELDLIDLDLNNDESVSRSFERLVNRTDVKVDEVLVQQMVKGTRELMAGLIRDKHFGPCVMFGLGGIFTEILQDISFRAAPLSKWDTIQMMAEIRGKKIMDAFRGKPPVNREALASILSKIGEIGLVHKQIIEIDINPLKLIDGNPVAVDALIVLK
ncbi:MAG: acetate--CoA ligase family protein [Proteobacteria bacterium]|nr:acetate--CoA ligase family protein [Pseudomonadota bacterium]